MKRRKYDAASIRRMRMDGLREGAKRINKVIEKTENPSLIQKVKKALKAVADPTNASAKLKLAGVLGALGAALVFANHMVDKKNKENMAHNARVIEGMRRMAQTNTELLRPATEYYSAREHEVAARETVQFLREAADVLRNQAEAEARGERPLPGMERFTRQPLALPNPSNPAHRATRANRGIPGGQRSLGI